MTEQPLTAEEAIRALLAEVQSLCPDCRSPKQAGTRHGYRCDPHRSQYLHALKASRDRAAGTSAVGEGLDVERLVSALIEVGNLDERVGVVVHNPHLAAQRIAREYAALHPASTEGTEG